MAYRLIISATPVSGSNAVDLRWSMTAESGDNLIPYRIYLKVYQGTTIVWTREDTGSIGGGDLADPTLTRQSFPPGTNYAFLAQAINRNTLAPLDQEQVLFTVGGGGGGGGNVTPVIVFKRENGSVIQAGNTTLGTQETISIELVNGKPNYDYRVRLGMATTFTTFLHTNTSGAGTWSQKLGVLAGTYYLNVFDLAQGDAWGIDVTLVAASVVGSITLTADDPRIINESDPVIFTAIVKDSAGAAMQGVILTVFRDQQNIMQTAASDAFGRVDFQLTFANPTASHVVEVTAGGKTSNSIAISPLEGGGGGTGGLSTNMKLALAAGGGIILVALLARRR